jgi:hypothetical protein
VVGGQSNTSSGGWSISGGYTNVASGAFSIALGNQNIASGQSAVALGHSNSATGTNSTTIGYGNSVTYQNGTAIGTSNTVGNKGAAIGGSNTISSGEWSSTIGSANSITSSGNSYAIADRAVNTASYGFSTGLNPKNYLQGSHVHANGWFTLNRGDKQITNCIASKEDTLTTGGTTVLSLDGTGTTNLIIPDGNNRAWNVKVESVATVTSITGTATGVSVGDTFMQDDKLLFKRVSGTSSVVGATNQTLIADTSMGTASITYSAGASQELAITFTAPTFAGGGSVTCRVVSKVSLVEVAY